MMEVWLRLIVSCTILGLGVGLLLAAALGSDGYSTMISGFSLALSLPFWVVNLLVGLLLVAFAWARGLRPGPGTVLQPVIVGVVVSAVTGELVQPGQLWARAGLLLIALPVVAVGVAGYLAADAGAGPTEAAAIALEPQIPFRWSYTAVQGGGAVAGWACGAAVGPGTVVMIVALGPLVSSLARAVPVLRAKTVVSPPGVRS